MIHPLIDPKTLTDDELEEKIVDLNKKILIINSYSDNQPMLENVIELKRIFENEQYERMMFGTSEEKEETGTVLETGPYPKDLE